MRYQNAENILPPDLLLALQQYAEGEIIYVPKRGKRTRRKENAYLAELTRRNHEILSDYRQGISRKELAARYFLSEKSIERILRNMKHREG